MLLSIIIISYNTAELTLQSVKSAFESANKSKLLKNNFEIILIDNNSQDKTLSLIKQKIKNINIKIIRNKNNLGFAKANNQGIKVAKGDYILLLNSDVIVLNNALENLINNIKNKNLDILAAQLLNKDKTSQPQGGNLPNLISIFNWLFFIDDLPIIGKFLPSVQFTGMNTRDKKPDWVGATAMLIKKEIFKKIGLLDPKIFMYGEDVEFCLRAKQAGLKIGIDKTAQIIHLGSASSSSKNATLGEIKGYLYIFKKHKTKWQLEILKILFKLGLVLRLIIFSIIKPDANKKQAYTQALRFLG